MEPPSKQIPIPVPLSELATKVKSSSIQKVAKFGLGIIVVCSVLAALAMSLILALIIFAYGGSDESSLTFSSFFSGFFSIFWTYLRPFVLSLVVLLISLVFSFTLYKRSKYAYSIVVVIVFLILSVPLVNEQIYLISSNETLPLGANPFSYRGLTLPSGQGPSMYGVDNWHAYCGNANGMSILPGVNPSTLKPVPVNATYTSAGFNGAGSPFLYAEDSDNVYYYCTPIVGADPQTFQLLGNGYEKDKNTVYYNVLNYNFNNWTAPLTGSDLNTFVAQSGKILFCKANCSFDARDKNYLYYEGNRIANIASTTIEFNSKPVSNIVAQSESPWAIVKALFELSAYIVTFPINTVISTIGSSTH